MPPALTPALALDLVRELSADVRAGLILDARGERIAGPPALAAAGCALATAAGDEPEAEAVTGDGVVCLVRTPRHAGIAVCGAFAIPGVVRADLRAALAGIDGEAVPPAPGRPRIGVAGDPLQTAAEALISALQRGFAA
jgi:hypothetical protein